MNGHWKKQFNYDYLGSYSLDGKRDVVVSVKGVATAKVTGQSGRKEDCFVVHYNEFDKPMILNRTNAKAIEKVAGSGLVEDWVGVRIILYVEKGVKAFGDVVDALRIREHKPTQSKMTKEVETAMMEAIGAGQIGKVELAVSKYTMSSIQEKSITNAIKKAKK